VKDPFKIDGPTAISFSGGRTSGYMLWQVLQAHQMSLPVMPWCYLPTQAKKMRRRFDLFTVALRFGMCGSHGWSTNRPNRDLGWLISKRLTAQVSHSRKSSRSVAAFFRIGFQGFAAVS
jgi:hypothetical protein